MSGTNYVCVITGRNEVVAKVMFLLVSVILLTEGVCLSACWDTTPPPPSRPPRSRHHPPEQTPPRSRHPRSRHPPPGSRLRHTVNERPVRILLECILGLKFYFQMTKWTLAWQGRYAFWNTFLLTFPDWSNFEKTHVLSTTGNKRKFRMWLKK